MQLSANRKGKAGEPPRRMCDRCKSFLDSAETKELSCEACAAAIVWPKEHQLKVELGVWVKPSLCADCRRARGSHVPTHPAPTSEPPTSSDAPSSPTEASTPSDERPNPAL
jgi:hypothetical protein